MGPFKTTSLNVSAAATIGSGLTISGNISGNNLRVSFNRGSAIGNYSFAEGDNTLAFGTASHAEGIETIASGDFSHAEGIGSFAVSNYSHAEGNSTKTGEAVNYETFYTNGVNICIFTFSPSVTSKFFNVTAGTKLVGYNDLSSILAAFTVIDRSTITGNITGDNTFGFGEPTSQGSEGYVISRTGTESHAEGNQTTASGFASHAEGQLARALGGVSHAEGNETTASGYTSHAEGDNTLASGNYSHAGGQITIARGNVSHASGRYVEAAHARTWIWKGSTSNSFLSTTRADQFMVSADGGTAFFGNVGIGTDNNSNALTVVGTISASQHGNSSQWNSTYTTVHSNSASWTGGGGGVDEEFVIAMSIGLS